MMHADARVDIFLGDGDRAVLLSIIQGLLQPGPEPEVGMVGRDGWLDTGVIGLGEQGEGCPGRGATQQVVVVWVMLGSFHLSIHLFTQSTNQLIFECAHYMPGPLLREANASKPLSVL